MNIVDEYRFLRFPADAIEIDEHEFAGLPDSAQRVFEAIRDKGPMTHAHLRDHTLMPPRTIRFAVKRLREAGFVDMRSSLRDCRTCYFFVDRSHVGAAALEEVRHEAESEAERGRMTLEHI